MTVTRFPYRSMRSSSATVLPRVDEDTGVEHRVDIRTERVFLFEVCLVDYTDAMHTRNGKAKVI